ncbi:hypothetical protein Nepgr_002023 [Nepenthes gracilis]|uniref:Phytocyanin domain-containing protein n=1 Tax=Nepenthes gracilis TaxID=150966 RepID=A0AAD3RXH9_NEPGR|nr:hypothetical protein Nepgr_002023 [Nepenthes gracilis]
MAGLVWIVIFLYFAAPISAEVYTVGDSSGWAIGVDYRNWTNGKTFFVGDRLVFHYIMGHTVDKVSHSDYKTCTVGNAITSDSTGSTSIDLRTPGKHYFICGVIGHCGGGMKLAVNVRGSSADAADSPNSSALPYTTVPTTTNTNIPVLSASCALYPLSGVFIVGATLLKVVLL